MLRMIAFCWVIQMPMLLPAQEILTVKHYGVDEGLPQSTVWDIIQDNYGFLWISTADGLCRFDGYTFNTYRNKSKDSLSIGGNTTHHLALDSEGNFWLTHDQGFDKYDASKGTFSPLFRYKSLRSSVFNKTIGEDPDGFIWVWIGGEGLKQYNRKTNALAGTFPITGQESWRNALYSRDVLLDKRGNIWITQGSKSLISFNTHTKQFRFISTAEELSGMFAVSDSALLIGTSSGLLRINTFTQATERIQYFTSGQSSSHYQSTQIIRVNSDEYWIGTSKGIFVYNDVQRKFRHHYTSFTGSQEDFLFVQAMFMDKSGNIWIGTNGDGLKKYSPRTVPWKHYRSYSPRGDIVKAIYADGKDLVMAGYFDNGLDIFSKKNGFVRKIRKGESPLLFPNDMVYGILGIDSSRVFLSFSGPSPAFGVYNYTSHYFKDLTAQLVRQTGKPLFRGNNSPFILRVDSGSFLFNCTQALFKVSFSANSPSFRLVHEFENEVITSAFQDSRKNLWIGTLNGFYLKKYGQTNWTKGDPAISKHVKTIAEDAEGNLWMGTPSGLYIVNRDGVMIRVLEMGHPLVNDFIYGLLRDDYGNMWFSHNKGLTKYDFKKKTLRNFSVDDGLQSNEFNTGAYFKSPSGELFFGGINGVNSFYPEDIRDNLQPPAVQITRIEIKDRPLVSPLVHWAQRKIMLSHRDNTIAFEFAGLEFTEPVKNQYAWRMAKIDSDWIYSGNKRFTRYANLPPGEYRFEVKASNNDGIWNENPASLDFVIVPPFWDTWWFRTVELMAGTTLIALVAYNFSRQRYKSRLQTLKVQQTIQHDRERISRELHDNIGAQLSLISSNLDWVNDSSSLTEADKKERIGQINELSKGITTNLRETIWALNKETISFADFTDRLKSNSQKQLSAKPGVKLIFEDKGTGDLMLKPDEALNLLRICQEAVQNAVKHSGMQTLILRWQALAGHYEIIMEDDGKGMETVIPGKDHYGLENIRKRALEIGAETFMGKGPMGGMLVSIRK